MKEKTMIYMRGMTVAVTFLACATQVHAGAVLFTAGADTSGMTNPVSIPPSSNPHIPLISPGVTLAPTAPIPLDGVTTGPLNGITYGPGAFSGSTGGTTGFINVSYTIGSGDLLQPFFVEVANVGDTAFQSGLALDNIEINGALIEGFESGVPAAGWTFNGFNMISGGVTNLTPTEGSSFLFMDTTATGSAAIFDTVDGTNAANLSTNLGLMLGDTLSFDIAFLTTDGTSTFHDYGLAAIGVPGVIGVVSEPAMLALFGLGLAGFGFARRKRTL